MKKDEEIEKQHELPYLFEKELVEKQNRNIYAISDYVSIPKLVPLTTKFYSKYDQCEIEGLLASTSKHLIRVNLLQKRPQERYGTKIYVESHRYGWIPKKIDGTKELLELNFYRKVQKRCDITYLGEKYANERQTEREHFNGLRFYLR